MRKDDGLLHTVDFQSFACGNEKLHKTWQGKESAQAKEPPDTQEVEVPAVGAGGDS